MTNFALLFFILVPMAAAAVVSPGPGISESLAGERAASIRGLRYELSFRIPESKAELLRGAETVRFDLAAPRQVTLDFEQKRDRLLSVKADDKEVAFELVDGHILI